MNGSIYSSNIKDLKVCYIIHFFLYGIIIIFNCFLLFEIFWLHSLYYYIYLSISIFGVFYFLTPIIPFVYILLKKLTKKRINKCKIISTIFCVLVVITGLSCTIILMMNAIESTDFCRECPFNLDNSCINNMYDNYVNNNINQKDLKEQCTNRRCIFNNNIIDNQYKYEYICNYEPTEEFDTIRNNSDTNETISQILCEKIENEHINKYIFEKEEILKYLKICNSYDDFYICQRIYEPKIYNIKINNCPKKDYLRNLVFFCLLSVSLNLIFGFIPWRVEFTKFKNILLRLRENNNRALSKSLNSTHNSSKVQKNEIQSSFKKEPTEIIIVYNETEENMVTIKNKDKSNDESEENKHKNNKSKFINNSHIRANLNHKNIDKYNIKIKQKIDKEQKSNNEQNDDNNTSIKIFKINDSHTPKRRNEIKKNKEKEKDIPKRKKEMKNYKEKENEKENTLIRSNSHRISYFSERNCFEESKSVQEI